MIQTFIFIILLFTTLDQCIGQAYRKPVNEILDDFKKAGTDSGKAKLLVELAFEYQTEKKDNDIKLLKQQDEINKAQLRFHRLTTIIVIVSIIVSTLLVALLYSRYRGKQDYKRQFEIKQQEINEKNITLKNFVDDNCKLIADKAGLLNEKQWLVKEIHHRVKNNLQLVISLLNVQSEFLLNPTALNAIKESRGRMEAIAIIHKKLYLVDGNATEVNMRSYIHELVETIKDCFPESEKISFKVDIVDTHLDISQSVPLGLILNEAITNAIKYAYQKDKKGSVLISLQYVGDEQLQLKIADNGEGLPAEVDPVQPKSLGLQLIKLFSEQLEGDLVFINKNGLATILDFKIPDYKKAVSNRVTA